MILYTYISEIISRGLIINNTEFGSFNPNDVIANINIPLWTPNANRIRYTSERFFLSFQVLFQDPSRVLSRSNESSLVLIPRDENAPRNAERRAY